MFVDLAPISTPGLVPSAVATAVGVRDGTQPLVETLTLYLRERHLLAVLDNFEHVLDAAPLLAELLAAAPGLKVLVTSRDGAAARAGEHEFPVPPLALPDPRPAPRPGRPGAVPAVRAVRRAGATRVAPDFALTDAQRARRWPRSAAGWTGCRWRIELAAARVAAAAAAALLARLEQRLELLTGGARDLPPASRRCGPPSDWSYDLLAAGERALFARLAVFAGGFSLRRRPKPSVPVPGRGPGQGGAVMDTLARWWISCLVRLETAAGEPRFSPAGDDPRVRAEQLREVGEAGSLPPPPRRLVRRARSGRRGGPARSDAIRLAGSPRSPSTTISATRWIGCCEEHRPASRRGNDSRRHCGSSGGCAAT